MRNRLIYSILGLTCAGSLGCHSGHSPFDRRYNNREIEVKAKAWTDEYTQAMEAPTPDCPALQRLAADSSSPVNNLAHVRDLQLCSAPSYASTLAELDRLYSDPQMRWEQPLILEVLVKIAQEIGHQPTLAKYGLERSKDLSSQREKEDLLKTAMAAADNLHMTNERAALEAELYRISPRLRPNPGKADWLQAADDFRINEEWNNAIHYYELINTTPGFENVDRFKSYDGIRQVHKQKYREYGGPKDRFLQASRQVAAFSESVLRNPTLHISTEDRQTLFTGWMQYPRDVWTYGDVAVARNEVRRVIGLPDIEAEFRAYAYALQSRIYANYGEWNRAGDAGAHATQILSVDLAAAQAGWNAWHWRLWDDAFWAAALAERKIQHFSNSAALLETAALKTKSPSSEDKFLFWAAQNNDDNGDHAQAAREWLRLISLDPFGFYGDLAHHKTSTPLDPIAPMDLSLVSQPASVSADDFSLLVWLTASGEWPLAQRYSRGLLSPRGTAIDELKLRAFVHDFASILSIFFDYVPVDQRDDFTRQYASLFYPEPYVQYVQSATLNNPRIDKEYVFSIMRQESGFDPLVRSWANAYGLLQLMPQVARGLQSQAGVNFTEDYELFRPAVNIPIGVAHMDHLIDEVGPSFIMRTMAYNATTAKVHEWSRRVYNGNVFEFFEEIPYEETRSYVRLVLRNYIMNKRLSAAQPFDFPPSLLDM